MRVTRKFALTTSALALALIVFRSGGAAAAAEVSAKPAQPAPVQIVVDGAKHQVAIVLLRDGDVLVPLEAFTEMGIAVAPNLQRVGGVDYVSLAALAPRVRYALDEATLELRVQVDPALLPRTNLTLEQDASTREAGAVPSGFLTYSLASNAENIAGSSGFFQAGFGTSHGLFLANANAAGAGVRRGLFSYQAESQDRMSQMTFGDQEAGNDLLGGSAIVGGIGFGRHWEFQPNYVFSPRPGISGTALQPLTADIYVNGLYQQTVQLQPGQFDFTNLPGVGGNVSQIVLHDSEGNTRTITGSSYVGQAALAKGLTDYDYNIGFLRPNAFGQGSDRYGPPAAVGTYRLGATNFVTLGGHFESTRGVVNGGPMIEIGPRAVSLSLEALTSEASGLHGLAAGAALEALLGRASINLTAETRSASYATIDLEPTATRTRSAVSESISLPIFARTSLSLSQQVTSFSDEPTALQTILQLTRGISRTVNMTVRVERDRGGSVFGLQSPGTSLGARWSVGALANIALRGRATADIEENSGPSGGASVSVSQPGPQGIGLGYTLNASSDGSQVSAGGEMLYRSQHGDLDFTAERTAGSTTADLTLSGSIAAFNGGAVFGEPIYGAYAFADTAGVRRVPIYNGDSLVGLTDGRGLALVTGLTAYQPNTITIGDLGGNSDLVGDQASAIVDPKTDSGVVADLRVHVLRAYFGHVVIQRNGTESVPQFARLTLEGHGHQYTVDLGSEGQFYFENLVPGPYDATVLGADYACKFPMVILSADGAMTKLGTFSCRVLP